MRALRITCFRLRTHVTDGVIDVIVEVNDVERLETAVDSDIQGLDDVGKVRRCNDDKNVVVGLTLCVEESHINAI
jgi:hypothetical protein